MSRIVVAIVLQLVCDLIYSSIQFIAQLTVDEFDPGLKITDKVCNKHMSSTSLRPAIIRAHPSQLLSTLVDIITLSDQ